MEKITGNEPINGIIHDGWTRNDSPGLTIRQHFAAMAMQGFCAAGYGDFNSHHVEHIARLSVQQADALINELNNPTSAG